MSSSCFSYCVTKSLTLLISDSKRTQSLLSRPSSSFSPSISAEYFAVSCVISSTCFSSSLDDAESFSFLLFISSISFFLERIPVLFDTLPPVYEPPALTTCPSRVTILNLYPYFLAMTEAESIFSATHTFPSRLPMICEYLLSALTSSLAIAT